MPIQLLARPPTAKSVNQTKGTGKKDYCYFIAIFAILVAYALQLAKTQ